MSQPRFVVVRRAIGRGEEKRLVSMVHVASCHHVDRVDETRIIRKSAASLQKWERAYGDALELVACRDCGPLWH